MLAAMTAGSSQTDSRKRRWRLGSSETRASILALKGDVKRWRRCQRRRRYVRGEYGRTFVPWSCSSRLRTRRKKGGDGQLFRVVRRCALLNRVLSILTQNSNVSFPLQPLDKTLQTLLRERLPDCLRVGIRVIEVRGRVIHSSPADRERRSR